MRFQLIILLALVGWTALAVPVPAPLRQSQQFTVVDVRSTSMMLPGRFRSNSGQELVKLDVDVLLLSAERVKETLLGELSFPAENAGRIRLFLCPAKTPDDLIHLVSTYSPGEWDYRVEIPDQIEPEKLVRGIVHVLLLEIANRGQGPKPAELPLWLVEGLTRHVMSGAGRELVVGSIPIGSMLRIVRETPKVAAGQNRVSALDSLQGARQILRSNRPLSFSELASPTPDLLRGTSLQTYQASAELFVYELLHLKNGPACLVQTVRQLPQCWNWQTALLHGFSSHFARMLDVEKKWSVDVLAFVARDPSQVWSRVSCVAQLDELLSVPAQVRVASDTLPERRNLTLQQVISNWDLPTQAPLLRQKLSLLDALRMHCPADVVPLVEDYRKALITYLQKRDAAARAPETRMQSTLSASLAIQGAVRELEQLDKRRDALRPEKALSVNSL